MNRRNLIFTVPLLAGAYVGRSLFCFEKVEGQVKPSDIEQLLDTSKPEKALPDAT